jgi:hypothetical protein
MSHRFNLGQTVMFTPGDGEVLGSAAKAKVLRLLPKEGADYQYHVQVEANGPARRVWENQLQSVDGSISSDVRPGVQ